MVLWYAVARIYPLYGKGMYSPWPAPYMIPVATELSPTDLDLAPTPVAPPRQSKLFFDLAMFGGLAVELKYLTRGLRVKGEPFSLKDKGAQVVRTAAEA